jgi:hypothetical protein
MVKHRRIHCCGRTLVREKAEASICGQNKLIVLLYHIMYVQYLSSSASVTRHYGLVIMVTAID